MQSSDENEDRFIARHLSGTENKCFTEIEAYIYKFCERADRYGFFFFPKLNIYTLHACKRKCIQLICDIN